MLRFELRHYMYLPPYLSHALCHPSTGVLISACIRPRGILNKLVVVGRMLSECWTLVQHIIKVYHHESGTEVPPYDINNLPFY